MSKKIPIKKFSLRILIFSVVMAGLTALFQWLAPAYASPALPFIVLFFFVITLFTIFIVLRDDQGKDGQRFVSSYMLSRIVKLFSCLIFLLIYILVNREDAWKFGFAFIIIYFIYSIYEVIVLKKESDDISKKSQNQEEKTDTPK